MEYELFQSAYQKALRWQKCTRIQLNKYIFNSVAMVFVRGNLSEEQKAKIVCIDFELKANFSFLRILTYLGGK